MANTIFEQTGGTYTQAGDYMLLTKIPLFILIRHTDLLQIRQVLRHIPRICSTMRNRLNLHDLLMLCTEKVQRL